MGDLLSNMRETFMSGRSSEKVKTGNSPNGYVATAMEINAQTKHCSAKCEKKVKVSNSRCQWAGCTIADVCMKFH